ncbi:MAG: GNAT family N-acetyltransferase [Lentisphaerae bacterium]|nr:GNAT family N-acetyltransferase [Lentisphaerota bacterium]
MKKPRSRKPGTFSITKKRPETLRGRMASLMHGPAERIIGLKEINRIHRDLKEGDDGRPFADRCLEALGVAYEVSMKDVGRVPEQGQPVIVVCNHCFGGLEGIFLASLLPSLRDDVRIMANYLLGGIDEFSDLFILVDPFGKKDAKRRNLKPMKESIRCLQGGGMLAMFPSGEVASFNLKTRGMREPPWSETVAGLVRRTQCPVLPVFFDGRNSIPFQLAGMVHPRLRTIMLPRQLLNKRGRKFPFYIGNLIPFKRLAEFDTDKAMTAYLRARTYNLAHRRRKKPHRLISFPSAIRRRPSQEQTIVRAVPSERLLRDVASLPAEQMLVESAGLEAWYARTPQIPAILREIGRLREKTFRAVGEGTGKSIDLDRYDEYYVHVFLWNPETREIIGAYRLGPTDEIVPKMGKRGLYTSSLFKYKRGLLRQLDPAIEMGRSFVREEYQKDYTSLYLVWKGVSHYIARYPRYRYVFGPVSINANYRSSSRDLLVAFLKENQFLPDMARLVKARMPLRKTTIKKSWRDPSFSTVVTNITEVECLIKDIETELQGMPILLKQYLKLGGKLLGFNIDPDFQYVCDGLILVDLTEADRRALGRYMSPDGLVSFLAYHGIQYEPPGKSRTKETSTDE